MLSMKKLETLIVKKISDFEALKKCEEGIHRFTLNWDRLTCNRCNFEFRIPEDELKDYLIARQPYNFWDDIITQKNKEVIQFLRENLTPLFDDAFELLNPRHKADDLLRAALKLLKSPLMPILVELDKRNVSINKIKRNCRFDKHLLTFEDSQSTSFNEGKDSPEIFADIKQSKGIWCKNCGLLILSMSDTRWNRFKDDPLEKVDSKRLRIRRTIQQYFKNLEELNWITLKEKERFQALINSYSPSEREELLKFFAKIHENWHPFFFINITEEQKIQTIQEYEKIYKNVLTELMQEINSPEELESLQRLELFKSQHSGLGKQLTAFENLSHLYRVMQHLCESLGNKMKEWLNRTHLFFQSKEEEKNLWIEELERNISIIKDQIKGLQLQKDAILYPDSEEHFSFF